MESSIVKAIKETESSPKIIKDFIEPDKINDLKTYMKNCLLLFTIKNKMLKKDG